MLLHNLKNSLRFLFKYKLFSFINIFGLGVGYAFIIVMGAYLQHEMNYDDFHSDTKNIFRLNVDIGDAGTSDRYALVSPAATPELKALFPQVAHSARIFNWQSTRKVKVEDRFFYEDGIVYADPDLFKILKFVFIHGSAKSALTAPGTIVIPKRISEKYYGDKNPIGEKLLLNDRPYTVAGVIENLNAQTHLTFDIFIPMQDLRNPPWMRDWSWPGMYTYVKLHKNGDIHELSKAFNRHIEKLGLQTTQKQKYIFQPVQNIHLGDNLSYDVPTGNRNNLYFLAIAAIFILLISCLNFVNLSTATATKRFKEIGIRKVVGARKKELVIQYLQDAILVAGLGFLTAILILELSSPFVQNIISIDLMQVDFLSLNFILISAGLILLIGIFAGIYPAFFVSAFKVGKTLKPRFVKNGSKLKIRKIIIKVQFTIAIIIIICTILMHRQINYILEKDKGFNPGNKIVLDLHQQRKLSENLATIKNEFKNIPGISAVAVSSIVPGQGAGSLETEVIINGKPEKKMFYYHFYDADFIKTYQMKLVAGQNFRETGGLDLNEHCLINQAALSSLDLSNPASAIGMKIRTALSGKEKKIIGVLENFHYRSLHHAVEPLIIEQAPDHYQKITVAYNDAEFTQILPLIRRKWSKIFPDHPFDYYSVSDLMTNVYQAEQNLKTVFSIFATVALFLAIFGLIGLLIFMIGNAQKEIAIRKICGAGVTNIIYLFSREFNVWVIWANLLAWPVAWFAIAHWLENFTYKINISLLSFIFSGMLVFFIASAITSLLVLKTAISNPIRAIRYE